MVKTFYLLLLSLIIISCSTDKTAKEKVSNLNSDSTITELKDTESDFDYGVIFDLGDEFLIGVIGLFPDPFYELALSSGLELEDFVFTNHDESEYYAITGMEGLYFPKSSLDKTDSVWIALDYQAKVVCEIFKDSPSIESIPYSQQITTLKKLQSTNLKPQLDYKSSGEAFVHSVNPFSDYIGENLSELYKVYLQETELNSQYEPWTKQAFANRLSLELEELTYTIHYKIDDETKSNKIQLEPLLEF